VTGGPVGRPMAFAELADLVGRTDPAVLLPPGRSGSAVVSSPVRLFAATPLGPGQVGVVIDATGRTFVVPFLVEAGSLRRATAGDGLAESLVAALDGGGAWPPEFDVEVRHVRPAHGERAVGVDQTHESVIVGEQAVVKWTVAAQRGEHPGPQRLRALDIAGFPAIPRPWAFVTWRPVGAEPVLVVSVAEYLPGARDGWTWCVDDVRATSRGQLSLDRAVEPASHIGRLTAQMHAALAGEGPAVVADAAQMRSWATQAQAVLDEALDVVDGEAGRRLRRRADAIASDLARIARVAPTPLIDVHGDFHVGQVLRHGGGSGPCYAFTDFDGNPVLDAEQRLEQQPAARDVAGMLASLDHVGRVVIHRTDDADASAVLSWIQAAQHAFLSAYRAGLDAVGRADLLDERLLRPLRAEQECREFVYAVRHLPHWSYVPDAALAALYPDDEE